MQITEDTLTFANYLLTVYVFYIPLIKYCILFEHVQPMLVFRLQMIRPPQNVCFLPTAPGELIGADRDFFFFFFFFFLRF